MPQIRWIMPPLKIDVDGLTQADTALRRFAATVADLRPFWAQLGERLATEAQSRWPLRRRSGRLRRSLTWSAGRLGKGGVYEPSPDALRFGSSLFYGRYAQYGTARQRATPFIHVDEIDTSKRLAAWLRARAQASGLEVT